MVALVFLLHALFLALALSFFFCLPLTHPCVFFSLSLASFPTHLLVLSFVHQYFLPPSFCIFLCPILLSLFLGLNEPAIFFISRPAVHRFRA
jgi:hypothetical protein